MPKIITPHVKKAPLGMKTFADHMTRPTSGFNYLRIILALSIVAWHSRTVTLLPQGTLTQEEVIAQVWAQLRAPLALVLPMFFALSGFLVAGSLNRTRLDSFVALRIFRIVPALAVEVILSAIVLGPLFTTFSYNQYFSDSSLRVIF